MPANTLHMWKNSVHLNSSNHRWAQVLIDTGFYHLPEGAIIEKIRWSTNRKIAWRKSIKCFLPSHVIKISTEWLPASTHLTDKRMWKPSHWLTLLYQFWTSTRRIFWLVPIEKYCDGSPVMSRLQWVIQTMHARQTPVISPNSVRFLPS